MIYCFVKRADAHYRMGRDMEFCVEHENNDLAERGGENPSGEADIDACANEAAAAADLEGHEHCDEAGDEGNDEEDGIDAADEE